MMRVDEFHRLRIPATEANLINYFHDGEDTPVIHADLDEGDFSPRTVMHYHLCAMLSGLNVTQFKSKDITCGIPGFLPVAA